MTLAVIMFTDWQLFQEKDKKGNRKYSDAILLQAEDFYGRNDEVAAEQDANSGSGNGLEQYGAE